MRCFTQSTIHFSGLDFEGPIHEFEEMLKFWEMLKLFFCENVKFLLKRNVKIFKKYPLLMSWYPSFKVESMVTDNMTEINHSDH